MMAAIAGGGASRPEAGWIVQQRGRRDDGHNARNVHLSTGRRRRRRLLLVMMVVLWMMGIVRIVLVLLIVLMMLMGMGGLMMMMMRMMVLVGVVEMVMGVLHGREIAVVRLRLHWRVIKVLRMLSQGRIRLSARGRSARPLAKQR